MEVMLPTLTPDSSLTSQQQRSWHPQLPFALAAAAAAAAAAFILGVPTTACRPSLLPISSFFIAETQITASRLVYSRTGLSPAATRKLCHRLRISAAERRNATAHRPRTPAAATTTAGETWVRRWQVVTNGLGLRLVASILVVVVAVCPLSADYASNHVPGWILLHDGRLHGTGRGVGARGTAGSSLGEATEKSE